MEVLWLRFGFWQNLRPLKAFEEGLSDAIRSGVQNEEKRAVEWPELPSDYGCAVKPWDRDHDGMFQSSPVRPCSLNF